MTANVEHSESHSSGQDSAQGAAWMIRTAENILSGPYTKQQIIQLIQEGKLDLTDEVCGSGNYWIFLHEEAEVKSQLGVDLPRFFFDAEESTQTETDSTLAANPGKSVHNAATGPMAAMGVRAARSTTLAPTPNWAPVQNSASTQSSSQNPSSNPSEDDENVPELSVPAESIEEQASVLSNRAIREFRPRDGSAQSGQSQGATRVLSMENALKESGLETADQLAPQFSSAPSTDNDSYVFKDEEVTPPPIEMPRSTPASPPSTMHNTSLSLDPEPADWTARFWGVIAFILIAAAAVVWFFAFRKPD